MANRNNALTRQATMEVSLQLDGASYVVKLTKHGERYHASLGER